MTIYFTSDLHIAHKKILTMGKGRPFDTIEQMSKELIDRWNNKVNPSDEVYVLGDAFWNQNSDQIKEFMNSLNGEKTLILGNHDRLTPNVKALVWKEITNYKEIDIKGRKIVLNHAPIFEWYGFFYHSVHLYGHTHGTVNLAEYTLPRGNGNCWDVGVDNNNYEPVSYEEILDKINNNIKIIMEKNS